MNIARHQRRLTLVPVLVVHAAVLAVVIAEGGGENRRLPANRALLLVDVAAPAPRQPSRPAPLRRAPTLAVAPVALPERVSLDVLPDAVPMPTLSEAGLAPGEACEVAAKVQAALRDDPKIRAALAMLPRDARSVANAVMLWDGRWVAGTTTSTRYALDQIRTVVVATVASAPAPCRIEEQAGPALMLLAGSPDTVLALGSGRWRWTDVFGVRGVEAPTVTAARADAVPAPAT